MRLDDFAKSITFSGFDVADSDRFGDRSSFIALVRYLRKHPSGLEKNPIQTLKSETQVFAKLRSKNKHKVDLLLFWEKLLEVLRCISRNDQDGFEDASKAGKCAIEAIDRLYCYDGVFNHYSPRSVHTSREEYDHEALFVELGKTGTTNGFWIIRDFIGSAISDSKYEVAELKNARIAKTPILFNRTGKNEGFVLWLTIELYEGSPGPFTPDVQTLGLTDVRGIINPIQQVWEISGLSKSYRGIWRITTRQPGIKDPYDPGLYPDQLVGYSLQSAALVAMWAASGRIPRRILIGDKPEVDWFELDSGQKPFGLIPSVSVSAAIDINYAKSLGSTVDDSIPLQAISHDSAFPKIEAMARYSPTKDHNYSLFDTAIICTKEEDRQMIRQDSTEINTERYRFRGIEVVDNCKNIGEVLALMLETNYLKHHLNKLDDDEWEQQWTPDTGTYDAMERFSREQSGGEPESY